MVRRMSWALAILVAILVVDIIFRDSLDGQIRLMVTLGGLAIVGLLMMFAYYEWKADLLVITNKRLISHRGIGNRTVRLRDPDRHGPHPRLRAGGGGRARGQGRGGAGAGTETPRALRGDHGAVQGEGMSAQAAD
jgi:hypothetical protein